VGIQKKLGTGYPRRTNESATGDVLDILREWQVEVLSGTRGGNPKKIRYWISYKPIKKKKKLEFILLYCFRSRRRISYSLTD
jgi:hypothetical protein